MADDDTQKKKAKELIGRDPRKQFYLLATVGNSDGSIDDLDGIDAVFGIENEIEAAIARAREEVGEHGMEIYIFHCIPIRRVERGAVRVHMLMLNRGAKANGK